MAHFTYVRAGGNWNTVPVDFSELQGLDQRIFKAINGDDGGTWAPASEIIIGGAGMQIAGPLNVTGLAEFGQDVIFQAGFTANTLCEFVQGCIFDVGFTSAGAITVGGTGLFNAGLTVGGAVANINAGMILAGGASVAGGISMSGDDLQCSGGAGILVVDSGTITSPTATIAALNSTVAALSRIRRPPLYVATGTATVNIHNGSEFTAYAGTADLELTFADTDAQDGESVEFSTSQLTESMILTMPPGTYPNPGWTLKNTSSFFTYLKFTRSGGIWYRTNFANGG